jgi:ABC-type transporter Mla subunit MlaD
MKLDEARQELQRVRAASERVSANLVELEIDSSRQLLEARKLTGESATRWSAASAALTKLWEWRGLLDGFLGHAEELSRGGRRMRELEPLLVTPSIELARSPVPLAERELLGSSEVTVRCTPDQLLERMSAAFDEVKTVVAEFGRAWDTLTPRLAAARGLLDQVQAIAASSGESGRTDLDEASDRLTRLGAALTSDPLSVAPSAVDRVIDSLEAIRRDLEATGALRRDFDARLADSRALLRQLQSIVDEAHAAHEELLIKIAAPAAGTPPELPADLDGELDHIAALARSDAWRDARRRLDQWTARARELLDVGQQALHENRAPIESRNQLRSLLEAYQVKASRLGTVEDPELERTFAQAHQALYTAPTDLALVAQLVRRYQERLSAAQPAREAIR